MKKNSKKLSKIIAPLALAGGCLATLPTTSCGHMYSEVKHIAPYLHEITYDDYREDTEYETIKEAEAFGCSSIRNGNFYGRNFDYIYNDTPEFIVHMKANEKKHRHASLAVSTHFGLREKKLIMGKYMRQLELIPNLTMDGINDAGVICSSNVVSMEPGKEKNIIPETNPDNPNAKNLHMLFIPRFVLDNASSVDDAITKLSSPDINIMGNLNNKNFLHIMIADKEKTAIVEFFHKKESNHNHFDVVAKTDKDNNIQPIMTNYYRNINETTPEFENDEKNGNERWETLNYYYDLSNSFTGMQSVMKKVQFSQAYEFGRNPVAWNEEATDDPTKVGDLNSVWYSELKNQLKIDEDKTYSEWKQFSATLDEVRTKYREALLNEDRATANPAFWITTHNSTYEWDWENNKGHLQIIVQEEYTKQYDFYQDITK